MVLYADPLDELASAAGPMQAPRAPEWEALRHAHLEREGWCRFCGATGHLQVHHIRPVHLFPELELESRNLITLCMTPGHECHLREGHLGSWWKWNRHIRHLARWPAPNAHQAAALRELLHAQGGWNFTVTAEGDDLVMRDVRATCFGGDADPQDDGETWSGINTRSHKDACGVALPMDGRAFQTRSEKFHAALDGSPIPRVPALTQVLVQVGSGAGARQWIWPVIDLGPAKYTGNALDLTPAAARMIAADASATNFEVRCSARIVGAAKFIHT